MPDSLVSLVEVGLRTVAIYLFGVAIVRIGKSRLLSRATSIDILMGFVLGSLLSRGINGSASLSSTMVASAVLVALHYALTALTCQSHFLGNLIKGHSVALVARGEMLKDNMRRSHISEHDLIEGLRTNGNVDDIAQVKSVYKERSGQISVIKAPTTHIVEIEVKEGVQRVQIEIIGA